MENTQPQASQNTDEDLNWESRLEKLRQTRQFNAPYTHAPLIQKSSEPAKAEHKLDDQTRNRVLQEYLLKWQEEHNAEAEPVEEVETDAMVLLQENWLSAQSSLQMRASEKQIESTRTVWFRPQTRNVEFPTQAELEMPSENQADSSQTEPHDAESRADMPEKITVNINVLNPQAINRKEVFCLSEKELAERLIKRMRPHVTDAVNGMIRVAVQKQVALFTYQLQQMLNEQAPELVEDVLEHNIKKVLADIKYEMKYKR